MTKDLDAEFAALLGNNDEYRALMERERLDAWRKISPMSNAHSSACCNAWPCYISAHYPEGDPLNDEPTELLRKFLGEES